MRIAVTIGVLALAAAPVGAQAAELLDSSFQVTYDYAGSKQTLNESYVPLLPGNACYTWFARLDGAGDSPTIVERFTLPQPLADLAEFEKSADTELEQDGKVLVTTLHPTPDQDGWVSHGWCVAKGDPVGAHRMELMLDNEPLTSFDFDVLAPEDYSWPAIRQPVPRERSVDNSW